MAFELEHLLWIEMSFRISNTSVMDAVSQGKRVKTQFKTVSQS